MKIELTKAEFDYVCNLILLSGTNDLLRSIKPRTSEKMRFQLQARHEIKNKLLEKIKAQGASEGVQS